MAPVSFFVIGDFWMTSSIEKLETSFLFQNLLLSTKITSIFSILC